MRNKIFALSAKKIGPVAFVVLVAGLSTACSDSSRLQQPLFTGSTDNQRAIIGDTQPQPMPPALTADSGVVTQAPLPPPSVMASASATHDTVPSTDGPYTWTAVGGNVITVTPGETLYSLAAKYGVPTQQLLSANQLSRPDQITSGRILVIPHRVAISPDSIYQSPAPQTQAAAPLQAAPAVQSASISAQSSASKAAREPVAAASAAPRSYVVQSGDTLYSISRKYGLRVSELSHINGLGPSGQIKVGQKLALSSSSSATGTQLAAAAPVPGTLESSKANVVPASTQAIAAAAPTTPVETKDAPITVSAAISQDPASLEPASADGKSFRWPVRGRIISAFGSKDGGRRNDGINLAVPEGTSVKAAEAGTVIYTGSDLEGYGKLVLIRHTNGWVSAYAHNKLIKVDLGDKVSRGQTVALAGMSGSVTAPQVHFELRQGAKPVNPLDYLTGV